ncbi:MAG: hypothetical protein IT336_10420, partial [Thermomicrobiales bacterium]|nr:hypothetical protein [Thermomicrobiales bacterium]
GDLQPFSLEDAAGHAGGPLETEVDFSDINDAPFDPVAVSRAVAPQAESPVMPDAAEWAGQGVLDDLVTAGEPLGETSWHEVAFGGEREPEPELPAAAMPMREFDGFGVPPGGVAWPAFVNHTSELIDRSLSGGNLFARLREAKRAAASAGLLQIDRSVRSLRPEAGAAQVDDQRVQVFSVPAANVESDPLNGAARPGAMSESARIDLMAMRVQLIEDASSAGDVAQRLESAVQQGLHDPLALRVLGEAYLKLGRTEQAAAQFRQAMLTRRRSR